MRGSSREPLLLADQYDNDGKTESLSDDDYDIVFGTSPAHWSATRSQRLQLAIAVFGCFTACCLVASATWYLGYNNGLRNPHPTVLMPKDDTACAIQWEEHASPKDQAFADTVISTDRPRSSIVFSNGTVFDRPADFRAVGVVFYGRREYASILECYLRRNLAVNGGILDEVRLKDEEDRRWLEELIHDHGLEDQYILQYEETENEKWTQWHTYRYIWSSMTDPNTIYVKIDDDIVYIEENAINELVRNAIEHPEAHSVVANVVNNAFTYWHHFRNGAVFPYLAEQVPLAPRTPSSWRPSQLPRYEGDLPSSTLDFTHHYSPPSHHHSWLPVQTSNLAEAMLHAPHGAKLPGPSYARFADHGGWAYAAQAH